MADTKTKPRRWMPVVLALSLSLNLLVVGLVGGAMWSAGPKRGGPSLSGHGGFSPYARALSETDRKATRQALRQRSETLRNSRRADRDEGARFVAALKAVPFDIAKVEQIFAAQRARSVERATIGQAVLFERITAMSAEERAAYAQRVEEELKRRPGRGRPQFRSKPPKD